jgi:hypothetical protein
MVRGRHRQDSISFARAFPHLFKIRGAYLGGLARDIGPIEPEAQK